MSPMCTQPLLPPTTISFFMLLPLGVRCKAAISALTTAPVAQCCMAPAATHGTSATTQSCVVIAIGATTIKDTPPTTSFEPSRVVSLASPSLPTPPIGGVCLRLTGRRMETHREGRPLVLLCPLLVLPMLPTENLERSILIVAACCHLRPLCVTLSNYPLRLCGWRHCT